jgi:hypothetical protein
VAGEWYPAGPGVWLRCQLHAHTSNSDGSASPAELCRHYARAGFDVLAITDHWHVTDHAHDGLVVIPSAELSARAPCPSGEAEALAIGVAELPRARAPFPTIEAMAAWIAAHGGAAYLCHPYWSGLTATDIVDAPSLHGIEIMNGGSELMHGNGLSTVHWDGAIVADERLIPGIATDDCHDPGADSQLAWTWVHARERSGEAVVAALRAGTAYGSSGPRLLDVHVRPPRVDVECSPSTTVRLRSGPWDGCSVHAGQDRLQWRGRIERRDSEGLITAASFEYPELWPWGRVELIDRRGRAWGNPFPLPPAAGASAG